MVSQLADCSYTHIFLGNVRFSYVHHVIIERNSKVCVKIRFPNNSRVVLRLFSQFIYWTRKVWIYESVIVKRKGWLLKLMNEYMIYFSWYKNADFNIINIFINLYKSICWAIQIMWLDYQARLNIYKLKGMCDLILI